jgi:DNA-binding transcriptional ArsR family regulator
MRASAHRAVRLARAGAHAHAHARARTGLTASAPVFAALGDETRLRLVARLCDDGPLSTAKLTSGARVTRQAVTKHLEVLEGAGLVKSARDGRQRVWTLEPRRLEDARAQLDLISKQWDDAIDRLRALVE